MTIAESVRLSILELSHRGMSVREIAAETGVSKNTVSKVVKEGESLTAVPKMPATVPKNDPFQRARATKGVSQKSGTKIGTAKNRTVVQVIAPTTITRDLTISELFDLLQSAKEDLEIARRSNDGSKDAVMAVSSSTKVVTEILKQMGKWCGLDDTLTGESKRDTVGRADIENMSLDEMRELVRDL